jgi:hypothetical protein
MVNDCLICGQTGRSRYQISSGRFPKSALHRRNTFRGLRKVTGTSKSMILVPLSI